MSKPIEKILEMALPAEMTVKLLTETTKMDKYCQSVDYLLGSLIIANNIDPRLKPVLNILLIRTAIAVFTIRMANISHIVYQTTESPMAAPLAAMMEEMKCHHDYVRTLLEESGDRILSDIEIGALATKTATSIDGLKLLLVTDLKKQFEHPIYKSAINDVPCEFFAFTYDKYIKALKSAKLDPEDTASFSFADDRTSAIALMCASISSKGIKKPFASCQTHFEELLSETLTEMASTIKPTQTPKERLSELQSNTPKPSDLQETVCEDFIPELSKELTKIKSDCDAMQEIVSNPETTELPEPATDEELYKALPEVMAYTFSLLAYHHRKLRPTSPELPTPASVLAGNAVPRPAPGWGCYPDADGASAGSGAGAEPSTP